jgi:HK97 family phage major capsid protein
MKVYAPLRQVVEVITTTEGNDLPWPVVDDTANTGAILGENTQASELDVVFTQKTLRSYVSTSRASSPTASSASARCRRPASWPT